MRRNVPIFALAALLVPGVVLAATPKTLGDLANQIVQIFNNATTDLIVLAIVIYFWGVSSSLFKQGEKGHEELRKQLIWGVFVIFLAVSIWGVVQLLQSSIFGSNIGQAAGGGKQTCTSLGGCQFGQ